MAIHDDQADGQDSSGGAAGGHGPEQHQGQQGEHGQRHAHHHDAGSRADQDSDTRTGARLSGRTFKVTGLDCAEEVAGPQA
jgi:hypothetical protein